MGVLAVIGIIILIYNLFKEGFERDLPADYHRNMKLEREDADKVRFGQMSRSEFNRNIRNGKYR